MKKNDLVLPSSKDIQRSLNDSFKEYVEGQLAQYQIMPAHETMDMDALIRTGKEMTCLPH